MSARLLTSHAQLTIDGREVPHPPREERPDWRLYVVLWELDERKSYGWVGVIGARSPADARKRTRAEYEQIPDDAHLVAVALRNWKVER